MAPDNNRSGSCGSGCDSSDNAVNEVKPIVNTRPVNITDNGQNRKIYVPACITDNLEYYKENFKHKKTKNEKHIIYPNKVPVVVTLPDYYDSTDGKCLEKYFDTYYASYYRLKEFHQSPRGKSGGKK